MKNNKINKKKDNRRRDFFVDDVDFASAQFNLLALNGSGIVTLSALIETLLTMRRRVG